MERSGRKHEENQSAARWGRPRTCMNTAAWRRATGAETTARVGVSEYAATSTMSATQSRSGSCIFKVAIPGVRFPSLPVTFHTSESGTEEKARKGQTFFTDPSTSSRSTKNTKNDSSLYTSSKNSAATVYALYEMSLNRISHARCDM